MRNFEKTRTEFQEILAKPIRELGLKLEGSPLERFVQQLYRELDAKGIHKFRPLCYLTDEWGCPSGEPVIGIPFYLANPELAQLERDMNDLEDAREIMMYMRHEAGHAFDYAYQQLVDRIINDSGAQNWVLGFGMEILFIPAEVQAQVKARWEQAGKPPIAEFLPFFRHMFAVDMFFYLGMTADLISRSRASPKVDITYLYYLPFCMIFTSDDKLHINIAPLFLRENQTFVSGGFQG